MRLAVFTSKYPARVATFFERDMRALVDAGVEIEVFPIYPCDDAMWRYSLDLLSEEHLPRDGLHHLSAAAALGRGVPAAMRRPGVALRDAAAVLAAAARYGPAAFAKTAYVLPKAWTWAAEHGDRFDHVLGYWGNYAGTCAWAFHRLMGRTVPFSLWLHAGVDLYHAPVFMRHKMRYADTIITCCDFNRDYIGREYPDLRASILPRTYVIHHGLDLAELPFTEDGRQTNRVVGVGRLARAKGYEYLLRAIQRLTGDGRNVELELVGDGDQRNALERLAGDLDIAGRVRFRGFVPFEEARDAIRRATVLVHPSDGLGDGLPNVIREAMALGTPVIASHVAGIPDALREGCGVLVAPKHPEALADAIGALLENPGRRRELAANARRRVEAHYDLWENGRTLARLLAGTTRANGRGRTAATAPAAHAAGGASC